MNKDGMIVGAKTSLDLKITDFVHQIKNIKGKYVDNITNIPFQNIKFIRT